MPITPQPTDALLVIDVQNDFMPGGNLAVPKRRCHRPADQHPRQKNSTTSSSLRIGTRLSTSPSPPPITSNHSRTIQAPLWPSNSLARSRPPAHRRRRLPPRPPHPPRRTDLKKGIPPPHRQLLRLPRKTITSLPPALAGYLRERNLTRLFLVGLAYDFCVRYSAIDGHALGFETIVIEDATRPVNLPKTVAETNEALADANVPRIDSNKIT